MACAWAAAPVAEAAPHPATTAGTATAGYRNPLRGVKGLVSLRIDEGVDYGGSGPVYALGDGVVTSTTGPWPDGTYLTYRLTAGKAKGKMVYVAENVTPKVKIGQQVTSSTVVGELHDAYPDMEIGWSADIYGDTMAAESGQWSSYDDEKSIPSAFGVNFNQLLVALHAPSGVMVHPTPTGKIPASWPRW
jgi:hypothetical protein